jgi:hypothetical protein
MTFMLSEDNALRTRLQGMTVSDQKSQNEGVPRQVGVWFGFPDQEVRAQNYPYVTIEMVDIQRDTSREMRGTTDAAYLIPNGVAIPEGQQFITDLPIPVSIDYQITTYARHPLHDRQIVAQLLHQKLPFRFGYLELDDNTVRRLDVMDVSKRDIVEQAKRLYQNVVTVRVSSEISNAAYGDYAYRLPYTVQDVFVETHEGLTPTTPTP